MITTVMIRHTPTFDISGPNGKEFEEFISIVNYFVVGILDFTILVGDNTVNLDPDSLIGGNGTAKFLLSYYI